MTPFRPALRPALRPLATAVLSLTLAASAWALDDDFDSDNPPSAAAAGVATAARSDRRYVWDLSTLFKDDAAWEAEPGAARSVGDRIEQLAGSSCPHAQKRLVGGPGFTIEPTDHGVTV